MNAMSLSGTLGILPQCKFAEKHPKRSINGQFIKKIFLEMNSTPFLPSTLNLNKTFLEEWKGKRYEFQTLDRISSTYISIIYNLISWFVTSSLNIFVSSARIINELILWNFINTATNNRTAIQTIFIRRGESQILYFSMVNSIYLSALVII